MDPNAFSQYLGFAILYNHMVQQAMENPISIQIPPDPALAIGADPSATSTAASTVSDASALPRFDVADELDEIIDVETLSKSSDSEGEQEQVTMEKEGKEKEAEEEDEEEEEEDKMDWFIDNYDDEGKSAMEILADLAHQSDDRIEEVVVPVTPLEHFAACRQLLMGVEANGMSDEAAWDMLSVEAKAEWTKMHEGNMREVDKLWTEGKVRKAPISRKRVEVKEKYKKI